MADQDPWLLPKDIFGLDATDWQGDDSHWLTQLASNVPARSSLGKSPYEQVAANEQVSLEKPATIDPRMVSLYSSKNV